MAVTLVYSLFLLSPLSLSPVRSPWSQGLPSETPSLVFLISCPLWAGTAQEGQGLERSQVDTHARGLYRVWQSIPQTRSMACFKQEEALTSAGLAPHIMQVVSVSLCPVQPLVEQVV